MKVAEVITYVITSVVDVITSVADTYNILKYIQPGPTIQVWCCGSQAVAKADLLKRALGKEEEDVKSVVVRVSSV